MNILLQEALIVTLFLVDIRSVYEPTALLPALNTLFLSIIPCFAAYTAARLFLSVGKISLLFVGCALWALGLGGFVSGWLIGSAGGPNAAITVYNSGTLICALLLLSGKIFISLKIPFRTHDQRVRFLIFSYFCVAIIFSGIVAAVVTGNTPLFILQGVGPTLLGKSVLITSIFCFGASAAVCSRQYNISGVKLFRWYATGLILLAIGLTGVLLQKYVGSPIGWAGRFSQYCGAACILAGLLDFWRTKSDTGQPLEVIFDTLSQKRIGELEHLNIELEQMISDQQSAEEALRVSEDRYRNLLGRVPAIIYNYSVRQGGLFYSPQVEQVFGYPLQEFYDNPLLWKESIHPDDVGTVECAISQLIKGGDKIDIE